MSESKFNNQELELMIDAIWRRQRCFIAGDERFREYGAILEVEGKSPLSLCN